MKNTTAARRTIASLRDAGRLELVDEALVQVVLSLAAAVDNNPESAPLWREYRAAVHALGSVGESHSDPIGDLVAGLFAEVGDKTST